MKRKVALLLAAVMMFAAAVPSYVFAATTNSISTVNYAAPDDSLFPDATFNWPAGNDAYNDVIASIKPDYQARGTNLVIDFGASNGPTQDGNFRITLKNAEFAFYSDKLYKRSDVSSSLTAKQQAVVDAGAAFSAIDLTAMADDSALITAVKATANLADANAALVALTVTKLNGYVTTMETLIAKMEAEDSTLDFDDIEAQILVIKGLIGAITTQINTETASGGLFTKFGLTNDFSGVANNDLATTVLAAYNTAVAAGGFTHADGFAGLNALYTAMIADFPTVGANPAKGVFNTDKLVPATDTPVKNYDYVEGDEATDIKWLILETVDDFAYDANFGLGYRLEITKGLDTEARIFYDAAADVSKNRKIVIPLVVMSTEDANCTVTIEGVTGGVVSPNNYDFNQYTGGATTTTVPSVVEARDVFKLKDISIAEKRIGVLKNGWFKMTIPDEYDFINVSGIEATADGQASVNINWYFGYEKDKSNDSFRSVLYGEILDYEVSETFTKKLTLRNVQLRARDYDDSRFGDIILKIEGVKSIDIFDGGIDANGNALGDQLKLSDQTSSGVTKEDVKVAKRVDWTVNVTAADAKKLYSGYVDREAAKLTIKEQIAGSWVMESLNTFKLVDADGKDVPAKFTKIEIGDVKNISNDLKDEQEIDNESNGRVDVGDGVITFKDNEVRFSQFTQTLDTDSKKKAATLIFTPYISVEAGYEGDIYVMPILRGTNYEYEPVLIAKVESPIEVTTKTTNVQIGYAIYPVADITITEREKGVLEKDDELTLFVESESGVSMADMVFNKITKDNNVVIDKDSGFDLNVTTSATNRLVFTVKRESDKAPATVTFKNLAMYINRSTPYGKYSLVVGGSAVCDNDEDSAKAANTGITNDDDKITLNDKFAVRGVTVKNYIDVQTEPSNRGMTNNVKITENSKVAIVNGEEIELGAATVLDGGSFLVPLRFITIALGIEEKNIYWDGVAGTATIMTTGTDGRVVIFTEGSAIMKINSADINMVDQAGNLVIAKIIGDRMYIPFRMLGTAYGVEVTWHADTGIAEYNPDSATVTTSTSTDATSSSDE